MYVATNTGIYKQDIEPFVTYRHAVYMHMHVASTVMCRISAITVHITTTKEATHI